MVAKKNSTRRSEPVADSQISVHGWEVAYEAEPRETAAWLSHQEDVDVTHGQLPAELAMWPFPGSLTHRIHSQIILEEIFQEPPFSTFTVRHHELEVM